MEKSNDLSLYRVENLEIKEDENLELYNPNVGFSLSLFFTPVFGAWIILKNWKSLGEKRQAIHARYWFKGLLIFYLLYFFLPWFDDYSYLAFIIPLLAWYFVEGRLQATYLKRTRIKYKKKPWLKPILIGIAGVVAALLLATIGDATLGTPRLDRSSPEAYEESFQEISKYLIEKKIKPLQLKEFRGEAITKSELEDVAAFKRLMLLLGFGSNAELNQLDSSNANELLEYARKKLQ